MQHLKVSGAVWPLKWSLGVKWLIMIYNAVFLIVGPIEEHDCNYILCQQHVYKYLP